MMGFRLHDSRLNVVREHFLEKLSRFCLLISFGHLLTVPVLFFYADAFTTVAENAQLYLTTITLGGIALLAFSFLCRIRRFRSGISVLSVGILLSQIGAFLWFEKSINHPVAMFLPMLCLMVPPIVGYSGTMLLTLLCAAIPAVFLALWPTPALPSAWTALFLLELLIVICTYISFLLWSSVIDKDEQLRIALTEAKERTRDLENWVKNLVESSARLENQQSTDVSFFSTPKSIAENLTEGIPQAQRKLAGYFGQLLLADRLSSVGLMASGIAHELNTPLTTLGFLLGKVPHLSEDLQKQLTHEIQRMAAITRGLLNFSTPKQTTETVDLHQVLTSCEIFYSHRKGGARLNFFPTPSPCLIVGVPNLLQQVLINLIDNALYATDEGVENPAVNVQSQAVGQSVILTVQDNGIGIAPENIRFVRSPFFTTKRPGQGTGLGLFIVQGIVEQHGANMTISSDPGRGTLVCIEFPQAKAATQAA